MTRRLSTIFTAFGWCGRLRVCLPIVAILAIATIIGVRLRPLGKLEARVLRMGFQNSAPYHYPDAQGNPTGPAVDVLKEAARHKNINLQWIFSPGGPDAALSSGAVDLWPLIGDLPERRRVFYITAPWAKMAYVLVASRSLHLERPEDLGEMSLAVSKINLDMRVARQHFGKATLVNVGSVDRVVEAVCDGRAQAGLLSQSSMANSRGSECPDRQLHASPLWTRRSGLA